MRVIIIEMAMGEQCWMRFDWPMGIYPKRCDATVIGRLKFYRDEDEYRFEGCKEHLKQIAKQLKADVLDPMRIINDC